MTVGNGTPAYILPHLRDTKGEVKLASKTVDGIAPSLACIRTGTVRLNAQNNEDIVHTFWILNTLHVPKVPIRILSPQYRSHDNNRYLSKAKGMWCATYDSGCILWWRQNMCKIFFLTIHAQMYPSSYQIAVLRGIVLTLPHVTYG